MSVIIFSLIILCIGAGLFIYGKRSLPASVIAPWVLTAGLALLIASSLWTAIAALLKFIF